MISIHSITSIILYLPGLRVLGIFRVGASKKRTNQLRDEFDSGKDVKLNDTHNPHEVGALLKEYFRDLPEPLLTRDLYSPLVATRGRYTCRHCIWYDCNNVSFTKTCPCNIQRFFSAVKIENFIRKFLIFLIFLLNTLIVGTR